MNDADNDAGIGPITGDVPSPYDAVVATVEESAAAADTARPPGPYDSVVTFGDSAIGPIIAGASTAYAVVLADPGVGPVVPRPPTPYTSVVFADSEVALIVGRRSSSPYDRSVVFDESDTGRIVVPSAGSPYESVVAPDPAALEPNLGSRSAGYDRVVPKRAPAPLLEGPPIPLQNHISFELTEAWDLPQPTEAPAGLTPARQQVMSWLQSHQHEISEVEQRRHIDRRAIAAAIAWEALENVWPASLRAVGPAKVHLRSSVVRQVEAAGYQPRRTDAQRAALLATSAGAIDYVGAIMQAQADIAASFGRDIRRNVPVLANEFNAHDLTQWRDHLAAKRPGAPFEAGNPIAIWASDHIAYLEAAVGTPDPAAFAPA